VIKSMNYSNYETDGTSIFDWNKLIWKKR
jgi:hypothetical protein